MLSLVEKLSFMTILCHFECVIPNTLRQLGCVIANIHVTLDHFLVTLDISSHFGQCHKRPCFLLVCKDPTKKPNSSNVTYNYICRPGIVKLFSKLLESKFAIGISLALPRRKPIPLLEYLVPKELYQRLSLVWGRDMCGSPKNDTLYFKPLKTLLTKGGSRDVRKMDQVLIIDD